jgi:putative DNA-invertase from lambdoid prophage Rac
VATILYARVSTVDQTIAHQEAQARKAGFTIDQVVSDHGVSGVRVPLSERPEGRRLFDMLRSRDTLIVRWVDRLGRNYADVTNTIREFMRRGVIIRTVINNLTFDGATQDPMRQAVRDALIAFMAATAQAQAEATKEAQRAGIEHAKVNAETNGNRYRGRKPSYSREQLVTVIDMIGEGVGVSNVASATGASRVKRSTVSGTMRRALRPLCPSGGCESAGFVAITDSVAEPLHGASAAYRAPPIVRKSLASVTNVPFTDVEIFEPAGTTQIKLYFRYQHVSQKLLYIAYFR